MEPDGIEPTTSCLQSTENLLEDFKNKDVSEGTDSACTNACTNSEQSGEISRQTASFRQALEMISQLPLSNDEKAEAIRRLLTQ